MLFLLIWALVAFFIIGAIVNWRPPASMRGDYERWGYPKNFNRVTSVLEGLTAALLALPATRFVGIALGAAIMCAAAITLLRYEPPKRVIAPIVVIVLLIGAGWGTAQ